MSKNVPNVPTVEEASSDAGFFQAEDTGDGQFDWVAEEYLQKQITFATDLECLTEYELWQRKEKFADYDYNITPKGNNDYAGAAIVIPGVPVIGNTELKYRTNASTQYKTTVIDTDKMVKLVSRSIFSHMPVWICWRFTDRDMYFQVDHKHQFRQTMIRNKNCTEDHPWEYKSVCHIPVNILTPCKADMFDPIGSQLL